MIKRPTVIIATGLAVALLALTAPAPASAADVQFLQSTADQSPGSLVISGFGPTDNLLVSIDISNAPAGTTFRFGTTTGLTPSFGWTFGSTMTAMNFTGTAADSNAALASMLISTGASEGNFTIDVSATANVANTYYNPTNESYYRYVASSGISWTTAQVGALALTYNGATGYLVNVTTASENDFIKTKVNAANVWIGGSDAAVEGVWRWMDGPEAGTQFWQGTSTGTATAPFFYASWSPGEPNNYNVHDSGGEGYAVINWLGGLGLWNDCPNNAAGCGTAAGYLAEFTPPAGGFTGVTTISRSAVVGTPQAPSPVPIWNLTYDSNGGSCTVTTGSGPDTSWIATPSSTVCTRSDHDFIGWNTAANGSGIGFTPGAQTQLSGDNTLYAQWLPVSPPSTSPSPATTPGASTGQSTGGAPASPARRSASQVIYFESGSSVLTDRAKARLRGLVAQTGTQVISVTSVGYVQESGSNANDMSLSTARATSVSTYLRTLGLRGTFSEVGKGIAGPGAVDRRARVTVVFSAP